MSAKIRSRAAVRRDFLALVADPKVLAAVRWLKARDDAEMTRDLSLRELAEMLLDGIKPIPENGPALFAFLWFDFACDEDGKDTVDDDLNQREELLTMAREAAKEAK